MITQKCLIFLSLTPIFALNMFINVETIPKKPKKNKWL
jgi:hypothetical protein